MFKRAFLAQGDRADRAVITQGLKNVTCSNPPPRVHIATLGMSTYCSACKQTGYIAPRGRRHPGTGPNGRQWALSGDVNICGCSPPPVFYAERRMWQSFTSEGGTHVERRSGPSSSSAAKELSYDELVVLRDEGGNPVAGLRYKLIVDDGRVFEGVTDSQGATQRVYADSRIGIVVELMV
ncbi:hypothetical protein AWB75_06540 [Caballeronia catudaia]|uniref:PAAR repeat-containing protein n=1 Tax=Caballeronia catudaia TaxID=1777136 RepID=A0A158DCS2_9BURK|nr:hypothetical protein AWB75_06540 [Caballeronia catudaia]